MPCKINTKRQRVKSIISDCMHACPHRAHHQNGVVRRDDHVIKDRFPFLCPSRSPWSSSLTRLDGQSKWLPITVSMLCPLSLFGPQHRSSRAADFLWLVGWLVALFGQLMYDSPVLKQSGALSHRPVFKALGGRLSGCVAGFVRV